MTLRILLAGAALVALFYVAGVDELWQVFSNLQWQYVLYLLLLSVIMIWASCLKWQLFIQAADERVGILHLMKLYTIGYFFNLFLPSYVGGDVARSYKLGQYLGNQRDAFVSTFLERFTGLLAMAVLGLVFVAIGTSATAGVELAIVLVGLVVGIAALACFWESFGEWAIAIGLGIISAIGAKGLAEKIRLFWEKLRPAFAVARRDRVLLVKALLYSLLFHVLTVVNTYVAARAVGWSDADFWGLFVVVPLVLIVSMVPLTPNGIGIQEGAFLFFLERVGATMAVGLSVGLVLRAKVILIALVGGLLLLCEKPQSKRVEQN